ncbi:MAG TPA: hypothetical protein VKA31_01155 [Mariprofundaceae bacterium]|nr:hypothetical protein [Mariprofundaceae bacterium]
MSASDGKPSLVNVSASFQSIKLFENSFFELLVFIHSLDYVVRLRRVPCYGHRLVICHFLILL